MIVTNHLIFTFSVLTASISTSFRLHKSYHHLSRRSLITLFDDEISPRKALFFDIVETGLRDRYTNRNQISRIIKFCEYSKNEIPLPLIQEYLHQPCEEYIEGLRAKPWWETNEFPWIKELEGKSNIIESELNKVLNEQNSLFKGDSRYMNLMGAGWTAFRLQRLGEWNTENSSLFPETTHILKSLNIPLAVRGVMFAKQVAGSGVKAHSDGRNFILTCHLGLQVPQRREDCWMRVAGTRKSWEKGKALVLDTSFSHETENNTDEDRFVLIIDFWHPDLTEIERNALAFIYDARNKFETGRVTDIDSSWVRSGKPVSVDEYVKMKSGFGLGGLFSKLFSS